MIIRASDNCIISEPLIVDGDLWIEAPKGGIQTVNGAYLKVTGNCTLLARDSIDLLSEQNELQGRVVVLSQTSYASLWNQGETKLDHSLVQGSLFMGCDESITFGTVTAQGGISGFSRKGGIFQTGPLRSEGVSSFSSFSPDQGITLLDSKNALTGPVGFSFGGNLKSAGVQFCNSTDTEIVTTGIPLEIGGKLNVISEGDLKVGHFTVFGDANLYSGGAISQKGPIQVLGSLDLKAPTSIALTDPNNVLNGMQGQITASTEGPLSLKSLGLNSLVDSHASSISLGGGLSWWINNMTVTPASTRAGKPACRSEG